MRIFRKKKQSGISFDPTKRQPALRASICTGEMTLGFVDRDTGTFHEYMLARSQGEVERFCRDTGIAPEELKRIY